MKRRFKKLIAILCTFAMVVSLTTGYSNTVKADGEYDDLTFTNLTTATVASGNQVMISFAQSTTTNDTVSIGFAVSDTTLTISKEKSVEVYAGTTEDSNARLDKTDGVTAIDGDAGFYIPTSSFEEGKDYPYLAKNGNSSTVWVIRVGNTSTGEEESSENGGNSGDDSISVMGDVIDLPIELIDYRNDSLLFEFLGTEYAFTGEEFIDEVNALIGEENEADWLQRIPIPGLDGEPVDYYVKNLTKSELDPNTGLPAYKDEVIQWVAEKVYANMNLPVTDGGITGRSAFFQTLRAQFGAYADQVKAEYEIKYADAVKDDSTTISNWSYWDIENYKAPDVTDPDTPTGGDWTQPATKTIYSKILQSAEGEVKYKTGCYPAANNSADTYKVVIYGYSDILGSDESVIYETTDYTDEGLFRWVSFTIDNTEYPYYRISYVPTSDLDIGWGNNYTLYAGEDIVFTAQDNGGWLYAFNQGFFSFEKTSGEEETTKEPGWAPVSLTGLADIYTTGYAGSVSREFSVIPGIEYKLWGWIKSMSAFDYQVIALYDNGQEEVIASDTIPYVTADGNYDILSFTVPNDCTDVRIVFTSREGDTPNTYGFGNNLRLYTESVLDNSYIYLGSLEDSKAKEANGEYQSQEDIVTCYDYAYYMLNHLFDADNVLGQKSDYYNTLRLIPANSGYGFFANYGGGTDQFGNNRLRPVIYDTENGIISNSLEEGTASGIGFFPLSGSNLGTTPVTTGEWAEMSNGNGTDNYHYAMKASGKFVYREEEDLFFDFNGDDDVYLFINGKIALDEGGAHLSAYEIIYLNDIADDLGLVDGNVYDFSFFYMERKTVAANIKVLTNIHVASASAAISKHAYNGSSEIVEGGNVSEGTDITYSLTIQNISEVSFDENGEKVYHPIKNLHFVDEMLGVDIGGTTINEDGELVFDYSNLNLGNDGNGNPTQLKDLTFYVKYTDTDGVVHDETYSGAEMTEEDLQYVLQGETAIGGYIDGAEITISGFKFNGVNVEELLYPDGIKNVATASFVAADDDGIDKIFSAGSATHTTYIADAKEYYAAIGMDVNIPIESNFEISTVVNSRGATISTSTDNKNIIYNATRTGVDTLTLTYKDGSVEHITVYCYGVNTNYYVLDYGLKVDLLHNRDTDGNIIESDSGILANDTLELRYNEGTHYTFYGVKPSDTDTVGYEVTEGEYKDALTSDDNLKQGDVQVSVFGEVTPANPDTLEPAVYGYVNTAEFTDENVNQSKVVYTPNRFMDDVDTFYYGVQVTDSEWDSAEAKNSEYATPVMTGEVDIMPASVVYYEDNYADIVGVEADGTNGIIFSDDVGEYYSDSSATNPIEGQSNVLTNYPNIFQSNDQSVEYGQDDLYINNVGGTSGYGFSYGSAHGMNVGSTAAFEFTGTGFDLISRINDTTGIVSVMIFKKGDEGTESEISKSAEGKVTVSNMSTNLLAVMSVNTYYTNGDLYQVPVISWRSSDSKKDANNKYVVLILTSKSSVSGNVSAQRMYIDGVRIYNPLVNNQEAIDAAYLQTEKNTEIKEIRNLILGDDYSYNYDAPLASRIGNTSATLVKFVKNDDDGDGAIGDAEQYFLTGSTAVEAYSDTAASLEDTEDLMNYVMQGPNNELYLSAGYGFGFELLNSTGSTDTTLQIGIKKVVDKTDVYNTDNQPTGSVQLQYLNSYGNWVNFKEIATAAETYYTIPTTNLYTVNGISCVVLRVSDTATGKISFTNLKVKGYSLAPLESEYFADPEDGTTLDTLLNPSNIAVESGIDKNGSLEVDMLAKVTFTTSVDVDAINLGTAWNSLTESFDNIKVTSITKTVSGGQIHWTVKFKVAEGDTTNLGIVAYDINGNYSEVVSVIQQ